MSTIDTEVIMTIVPSPTASTAKTVDLPVTLSWDETDPFALSLTFHGKSVSETWVVCRDLFASATRHHVGSGAWGQGDVRLTRLGPTLWIRMETPEARMTFRCMSDKVADFLARTFADCPTGSEALDVDGLIQQIFNAEEADQ